MRESGWGLILNPGGEGVRDYSLHLDCGPLKKKKQWSLNYPFGRNQTIQMYGKFQGFPI